MFQEDEPHPAQIAAEKRIRRRQEGERRRVTYLAYRKKDGLLGNTNQRQDHDDSASNKEEAKGNEAMSAGGTDETAIFQKDESANVAHSGKGATPTSAGELRKSDEKAI